MPNYDFTACLSPLDFELLSKDLLEAELSIKLENFSEGRDKGIDLRYAPIKGSGTALFNLADFGTNKKPPELIVQCKRFSAYSNLKSILKNKELEKIRKIEPARYILTTSAPISQSNATELKNILSPFVQSTGDIFGPDRLNSILKNHPEIERRNIKLWLSSTGVLESIVNAKTHIVSLEELERTLAAAKLYVRNESFDEALAILKKHRVCVISGLPGIGKTTLARMLMLYFYDSNFDIVKISGDISEARTTGYHNRPCFYYYDDFLGQTAQADKLGKNEDQRLIDFMVSVKNSKESVFVLTTREYILNQARFQYEKFSREKFDHRTCTIDLSKYSRRIRAQILYNHLHFSNLPGQCVESLVSGRGYKKIVDHANYNPRLIEYLTDHSWIGDVKAEDYLCLFLRKLDNPVEIWEHAFRHQICEQSRHLLFIVTTLPAESRIEDVEAAFNHFHERQCAKTARPHLPSDFNRALKELDGTFLATRKFENVVSVRFQNPSIRDFMQFLLFNGELFDSILSNLVFFEQAQWFAQTLQEKPPQFPHKILENSGAQIVESLKRLVGSNSCKIYVKGYGQSLWLEYEEANLASRLSTIAEANFYCGVPSDDDWVASKIEALAENLEDGKVSPSSVVDSIESLRDHGLLSSSQGNKFKLVLKHKAMSELAGMDEYEALVDVLSVFPETFDQSERDFLRDSYADFASKLPEECGETAPSSMREEASRLEEIGKFFEVDTSLASAKLVERADEIENEEISDWDRDEEGTSTDLPECSDQELDSIFSTLSS